ncbi:WYL domain-containing protein, partial [Streptomyces sp. SID4982]|nr:WYL domain-containing protein [Streptomyces sp. SID4982]
PDLADRARRAAREALAAYEGTGAAGHGAGDEPYERRERTL